MYAQLHVSPFIKPAAPPSVKTRYTKAQVAAILRNGTRAIHGAGPDTYGFAKVFYGAIAHSLFASIYAACIAKSQHGRDELGFRWVDLKPETKAYSRKDARAGVPLPGPKYRPTLTPAQDKAWRGRFAGVMRHLEKKGVGSSPEISAGSAWNFVKERLGAMPLIDILREKKIPLLAESGDLLQSLAPAEISADGQYRRTNYKQIFRVSKGALTVGTAVPHATAVDRVRPLWPKDISVWMDRAVGAGQSAILSRLSAVLST
jgi:hypothetical protein